MKLSLPTSFFLGQLLNYLLAFQLSAFLYLKRPFAIAAGFTNFFSGKASAIATKLKDKI
jgi:hypothetical protein